MKDNPGSSCGITTEHTVWCSQCVEWYQEGVRLKSRFVRLIKSQGWKYMDGQWICPDCSKGRRKRRYHTWKCQKCGSSDMRTVSNSPPRSCPHCGDTTGKSYVGYLRERLA